MGVDCRKASQECKPLMVWINENDSERETRKVATHIQEDVECCFWNKAFVFFTFDDERKKNPYQLYSIVVQKVCLCLTMTYNNWYEKSDCWDDHCGFEAFHPDAVSECNNRCQKCDQLIDFLTQNLALIILFVVSNEMSINRNESLRCKWLSRMCDWHWRCLTKNGLHSCWSSKRKRLIMCFEMRCLTKLRVWVFCWMKRWKFDRSIWSKRSVDNFQLTENISFHYIPFSFVWTSCFDLKHLLNTSQSVEGLVELWFWLAEWKVNTLIRTWTTCQKAKTSKLITTLLMTPSCPVVAGFSALLSVRNLNEAILFLKVKRFSFVCLFSWIDLVHYVLCFCLTISLPVFNWPHHSHTSHHHDTSNCGCCSSAFVDWFDNVQIRRFFRSSFLWTRETKRCQTLQYHRSKSRRRRYQNFTRCMCLHQTTNQ